MEHVDIFPPWDDPLDLLTLSQDPSFIEHHMILNDLHMKTPALSTQQAPFWSHPRVPRRIRLLVRNGASPDLDLKSLTLNSKLHLRHMPSYHCCRTDREIAIAANQLAEAEQMGALIPIAAHHVKALSKFFIAYNGSTPRVVCHPKYLNLASSTPVSVAYEDLRSIRPRLLPGHVLTSIDLKKAYWQVALAQWLIPWTAIKIQNRFLAWRSLILGLNFAPAVFTMLTQPIMNALRSWNILVFRYIDDLIIISQPESALRDVHLTFLTLRAAGLVCNLDKSVLIPTLSLRHLGLIIDLQHVCFRVPTEKLNDMCNLARALSFKSSPKATSVAKLIGKLISAQLAINMSYSHTWSLIDDLYQNGTPWGKRITLSQQSRTELLWLADHLPYHASKPIQPRRSMIVLTDASDWGAGICIPALGIMEKLPWPQGPLPHIMVREFHAVILALQYLPHGQVISILTDNMAVLWYLKKRGGRKNSELKALSSQLWARLCHYQLEIENAFYIPSRLNIAADALSRGRPSSMHLLRAQCKIIQQNLQLGHDGYIAADSICHLSRS